MSSLCRCSRPGHWRAVLSGLLLGLCLASTSTPRLDAQRGTLFLGSADDPAIQYATAPLANVVDDLNRRLRDGSTVLEFAGRAGYLQSVLEALRLPVDSQLLVYSQGSLQGRLIGPANPRALFFNDRVALGWVRDGDLLEVAAHDDRAGVVFYTLPQRPAERPTFTREFRCLGCHMTGDTSGVPGLVMFSSTPEDGGDRYMNISITDHRTSYGERFGGWFVTGAASSVLHRGNRVPALAERQGRATLETLDGLFPSDGYPAHTSDIAALLTFSHQTQMVNALTRASWEARVADPALHPNAPARMEFVGSAMKGVAVDVVDYMVFADEPPLPAAVANRSRFVERFAAIGPRDRQGRSLYELDLNSRLLKYPCSYMIYSPAFDALPMLVKTPIYERLWAVLSGDVRDARYGALPFSSRLAIVEILRETKPDLPAYFRSADVRR